MRVVFFGSSPNIFSNRHYAALEQSPCDIVAVVDTPAKARSSTNTVRSSFQPFTDKAVSSGIPVFEPNSPNEFDFVREIGRLEPDLFIAVGYIRLLKEDILSVPRVMAMNFHASLLPAYRGKHPVFWALRHGEKSAGLTVHAMDPHLDTGDILYQVRVRTRRRDTVAALYDRIMDASTRLVGPPGCRCRHGHSARSAAVQRKRFVFLWNIRGRLPNRLVKGCRIAAPVDLHDTGEVLL